METVFFYGLFMDADLLRQKGLRPTQVQLAYVKGYGLRIGQRATLEQSSGEVAYGAVMQLNSDELTALYSEASVADYRSQPVQAFDMEGQAIEATSYLLGMDKVSGRNSDYARSLAEVAQRIGLPQGYIKEINSWL